MKEGYQEEFKNFVLALSLAIVIPPSNLSMYLSHCLSRDLGSPLSALVCYAAFAVFVYAVSMTMDCLIPHYVKDWLLYPKIGGHVWHRPGETIFSKIRCGKLVDSRFVTADVLDRYRVVFERLDLAESQNETYGIQNKEWYRLYRKHGASGSVQNANRAFLYGRDVCALSMFALLLMGLLDFLTCIFMGITLFSPVSIVFAALFTAMGFCSAHLKGRRLVMSVIACDLAASDRKEKE